MSSSSTSLPEFSQDFGIVPVAANLGAPSSLLDHFYNIPQNIPQTMPSFPTQRLGFGTPVQLHRPPFLHLQSTSNTPTINDFYYPNYFAPSPIPSMGATHSSITSRRTVVYPPAMNYYIPEPILNMNQVVATQQVAPVVTAVEDEIGRSQKQCAVESTITTATPIGKSIRRRRRTPYTRPAASTSSET
ncbi:hypothetical protein BYT27DRAFT_7188330 [Phlegmacium glaucopus]|nr:hypothetical protein BYT27DRAFT_7188330 [Phlegmacium glaucopus]